MGNIRLRTTAPDDNFTLYFSDYILQNCNTKNEIENFQYQIYNTQKSSCSPELRYNIQKSSAY